jgi:UDP-N-acetylglucosamine--N-acetylmuramyl-(pentapeptide) pyrophosphoryl-undecaprenol N-acetylglucosamine transferase
MARKLYFEDYKVQFTVQVVAFIERMDFVYASADIIISRASVISVGIIIVEAGHFIPSPMWLKTIKQKTLKLLLIKKSAFIERI